MFKAQADPARFPASTSLTTQDGLVC